MLKMTWSRLLRLNEISFPPRSGVTFPNFWFFLNECSVNNHYFCPLFWTKVTCQFLAFPKENSGNDGLAKSHFVSRKNLLHAQMIGSLGMIWFSSICLFLYDFQWHRVGYLRLKPHDHLSGKSTYIITWCKTLIRATFQSRRKNSDLVKSRLLLS